MTVKRLFLCVLLFVFAQSILASESTCRAGDTITGDGYSGICGSVYKLSSSGNAYPTTPYNVMLCQADGSGNPPASPATWPYGSCVAGTTIYSSQTGGYSYYEFARGTGSVEAGKTYYIYVWNDAENYGNSTVPSTYPITMSTNCYQWYGTPCGAVGVNPAVQPRPLPPSAVYPTNNQQDVPQSFTLRWTTGKDAARSGWTASYDVYGHGMGASDLLEASNVACNPDASGNCTLAVPSVKSNSYIFWHVVAKFASNLYANKYLTTSSDQFTFTTLTVQSVPVSFGTNDWAHFLTAYWCGGSSFLATAVSPGSCESFKVINQTYHADGDIYNGDTVALQLGPYYVSAIYGGGSNLWVASTSVGASERFTINKVSSYWSTPGTRIMNQDRFSLTSSGGYFINAYNGGGGSVDACNQDANGNCTSNTTFNASNQTFVYCVHD